MKPLGVDALSRLGRRRTSAQIEMWDQFKPMTPNTSPFDAGVQLAGWVPVQNSNSMLTSGLGWATALSANALDLWTVTSTPLALPDQEMPKTDVHNLTDTSELARAPHEKTPPGRADLAGFLSKIRREPQAHGAQRALKRVQHQPEDFEGHGAQQRLVTGYSQDHGSMSCLAV